MRPSLKTVLGLALGALAAAGCATDPNAGTWIGDEVTHNDFESAMGWVADPRTLTRDHAHSGRYAVLVDGSHEYGLTYNAPLREASVHQLKAAEVEGWAYLPSERADASLNVEVWSAAEPAVKLYGDRLRLLEQVHEYAKWTPVRKIFALPTGLPPDARLRIFLWRGASAEPVYFDDLRVKARE